MTRAGGQISAQSERGQGARFSILLPRDGQPLAPVPVKWKEDSPTAPRKARILVIEDQDVVLKMVCRLLERQSYEVLQARSAEEALALYKELEEPLDLVLTDVILPGMSGVDFCRRIGRDGPALLLMSGYTEQSPMLGSEMLPLLPKPFLPRELIAKVEGVLASRQRCP